MISRREFCQRATLISLAPTIPGFLTHMAQAASPTLDDRILVIIQLSGGNDGLNTVVPYNDDDYRRLRPKLAIAKDRVHRLNDTVGLHPAMKAAHELFTEGRLAIVLGVGYPNPNKSHDVSMSIWQTARLDPEEHRSYGWIGRALDELPPSTADQAASILVGKETPPMALRGRHSIAASFSDSNELNMVDVPSRIMSPANGNDLSTYLRRNTLQTMITAERLRQMAKTSRSETKPPDSELANRLALIAQLIKCDFGARVYYVVQSGYDTHALQLSSHERLLRDLSRGLKFFLDELKRAKLDDRVLVMAFSEFGRPLEENASEGTDHGTAGPVFLAGSNLRAGLHGTTPRLDALSDGDLPVTTDFRQVYQQVLNKWLKVPSLASLNGEFPNLEIL